MSLAQLQLRMTEMGISQRIAHNLARYKSGQSKAYTVTGFIVDCREVMEEFKIPNDVEDRIIDRAKMLMQQDLIAISQSKNLASDGSSECTAYALLCEPVKTFAQQLESASKKTKN